MSLKIGKNRRVLWETSVVGKIGLFMRENKFLILFFSIFLFTGCSLMWATEFDFAENNFNGGNLAIDKNKDKALLFYIAQEKVEFIPVYNDDNVEIDVTFKEEWMKDTGQRLNRMSVEVLSG